jgi:hypothetical protein
LNRYKGSMGSMAAPMMPPSAARKPAKFTGYEIRTSLIPARQRCAGPSQKDLSRRIQLAEWRLTFLFLRLLGPKILERAHERLIGQTE